MPEADLQNPWFIFKSNYSLKKLIDNPSRYCLGRTIFLHIKINKTYQGTTRT